MTYKACFTTVNYIHKFILIQTGANVCALKKWERQKMRHVTNFMEQSPLWMLTNPQPVNKLPAFYET